ncbi:MAG: hypothetical protein IH594_09205, partial [Bacteroidales bacterium]|nr:hypothetical protein [Bacteroidales bacterium]
MKPQNKNYQDPKILPKGNPFSVPEGYFKSFSERLEKTMRTKDLPLPGKKINPFQRFSVSYFSLAAGFLAFVAISYALIHLILNGTSNNISKSSQYATYIDLQLEDYDDALLFEAVAQKTELEAEYQKELSEEKMIEFLLREGIELDLIINEL